MRTWILCMALASGLAPAFAQTPAAAQSESAGQDLLAQVREQIKDAPVVRGQFTQEKTVKGFKQPLRSSGDFVVAKDQGIVWQVRKPFASSLVVKPESLQSRRADGSLSMQMRAQDEPVLRTVNAMLFAVMSADLVQLRQLFEISGKAQTSGWQLRLVPRDPMLSQWLASIELQGGQFVGEVHLQEARGDSSLIRIQGAEAASQLSDAEAMQLR